MNTDIDDDYATAWEEWATSGDQAAWETTIADGLTGFRLPRGL